MTPEKIARAAADLAATSQVTMREALEALGIIAERDALAAKLDAVREVLADERSGVESPAALAVIERCEEIVGSES